MGSLDLLRMKLINDYTSKAVRVCDRIEKKIAFLEFEELYKVKGKYQRLFKRGTAFDKMDEIKLSPEAQNWLRKDEDIINWKIGALTLDKINKLFGTELSLMEVWDLATLSDGMQICMGFQLGVNMEEAAWEKLDTLTQREIRIIFDSIDNSKYFIHAIDGYFLGIEEDSDELEYKNHLLARL